MWPKGLKRGPHSPQHTKNLGLAVKKRYAKGEKFGFQKGNKLADNPKAVATRFKKGNPKPKNAYVYPKGVAHHMWKGGVTPEHEKIRKSNEYILWRNSV